MVGFGACKGNAMLMLILLRGSSRSLFTQWKSLSFLVLMSRVPIHLSLWMPFLLSYEVSYAFLS